MSLNALLPNELKAVEYLFIYIMEKIQENFSHWRNPSGWLSKWRAERAKHDFVWN